MVTPELVSYIYAERKKGVADHIIKAYLATQNWSEADFYEAVRTLPPRGSTPVGKPDEAAEGKIKGADLRTLDQNAVWRTPDGKADMPARPVIKEHKGLIKAIVLILLIVILGALIYLYKDILWPMILGYYAEAKPFLDQAVTVIRMATDFSH
ncbi:MAG: hypothetical protein JWO00_582 [Candidatus Parcubacteria bacterium]|nr:hypothetical protein [Candidatus Parcubacteria bacterium]